MAPSTHPTGRPFRVERHRARRSAAVLAMVTALILGLAGCSDEGGSAGDRRDDAVAAAEKMCPIMWQWVKDVGESFNLAAADVADIPEPEGRRARWFDAFDQIEELNDGLSLDLAPYTDHPILAPLVAEVQRDLPRAADELDDIRTLFDERPEIDEQRHQDRTMQVIVRLEKVIDLPKPELAPLDTDGTLIPAFRSVPSCQQSIKDVDDGNTRANG